MLLTFAILTVRGDIRRSTYRIFWFNMLRTEYLFSCWCPICSAMLTYLVILRCGDQTALRITAMVDPKVLRNFHSEFFLHHQPFSPSQQYGFTGLRRSRCSLLSSESASFHHVPRPDVLRQPGQAQLQIVRTRTLRTTTSAAYRNKERKQEEIKKTRRTLPSAKLPSAA
jgi:hypothetical protein